MHVGLLDTEHYEGVLPLISLFDLPGNRITLFTNRSSQNQLWSSLGERASRYQWVLSDSLSHPAFLMQVRRTCLKEQIDLLYLNTVSHHHLLYAALVASLPRTRSLLTLHDLNCFFRYPLKPGMRNIIRYTGRKALQRSIDCFNVVSDTLLPALASADKRGRPHYCLPGSVYEQRDNAVPVSVPLRLVIPGTIDEKRRNYAQVRTFITNYTGSVPLEIFLLGGCAGTDNRELIRQIEATQHPRVKTVTYHTESVPQHLFDQVMDEAHVIWIPSVVHTQICEGIPEIYGLTKSSGNLFDIIKHGKPFFAPVGLQLPDSVLQACHRYHSLEDLYQEIDRLKDALYYQEWTDLTREACKNFLPDNIRARYPGFFSGDSHDHLR